jgi:SAM-dependent methyltransferase
MTTSTTFTDGEAYERLMGRWSQAVGVQFLQWLDAGPQKSWLDVGCGTGAFAELVLQHANPSAVTGIDPSTEQISYARKKASAAQVKFDVGDAQAMPFADNSFDVSAMALVIAFVPDPAKAVAEMARVTRPGGLVASYMWDLLGGGFPLHPVDQALKALGHKSPRRPNAEASKQESLLALWTAAGLRDVCVRQFRIPVVFKSIAEILAAMLLPVGPLGSYIASLPESEKTALKTQLHRQLGDGPIAYEAVANAIAGRV